MDAVIQGRGLLLTTDGLLNSPQILLEKKRKKMTFLFTTEKTSSLAVSAVYSDTVPTVHSDFSSQIQNRRVFFGKAVEKNKKKIRER